MEHGKHMSGMEHGKHMLDMEHMEHTLSKLIPWRPWLVFETCLMSLWLMNRPNSKVECWMLSMLEYDWAELAILLRPYQLLEYQKDMRRCRFDINPSAHCWRICTGCSDLGHRIPVVTAMGGSQVKCYPFVDPKKVTQLFHNIHKPIRSGPDWGQRLGGGSFFFVFNFHSW